MCNYLAWLFPMSLLASKGVYRWASLHLFCVGVSLGVSSKVAGVVCVCGRIRTKVLSTSLLLLWLASLSLKILSGARSCLALMENPSFQRRKEGFMLHASTSLCPAPVVGSSGAGREDLCSSFLVRRQYLAHTYFTSQHAPASTLYCHRFIYLLSLVSIGIWPQQVSFMQ